MARGKVITTHLRTGDPNGIRTVFISNKICEMIVFPKSEFEMVSYCSGRSTNGWEHWINDAGQSLDELYRSE